MENKPWIFQDEGVYESINEELGGGARYSFAYVKFNGSSDYVKKYRDLIASAPSLQSEIDKLKKDKDDIENTLRDLLKENAILTGELRQYALRRDLDVNSLKKEKTDLQSEIDRLKEEKIELIKGLKFIFKIQTEECDKPNSVIAIHAKDLLTRIK